MFILGLVFLPYFFLLHHLPFFFLLSPFPFSFFSRFRYTKQPNPPTEPGVFSLLAISFVLHPWWLHQSSILSMSSSFFAKYLALTSTRSFSYSLFHIIFLWFFIYLSMLRSQVERVGELSRYTVSIYLSILYYTRTYISVFSSSPAAAMNYINPESTSLSL